MRPDHVLYPDEADRPLPEKTVRRPRVRILFVCHGNICRSPIAEFVMKQLVSERGLADSFEIASAATSTEEIGADLYPPAKAVLRAHGVPFVRRAARQVRASDYDGFDLLVCMDANNKANLPRLVGPDAGNKIRCLMDFTAAPHEIADPWYTGDFETAFTDIAAGCAALLAHETSSRPPRT